MLFRSDYNDEDINFLNKVKNFLCFLNPENFSNIVASGVIIQFILSLKVEIVKYMPIALPGKPVNIIKGIGFNDYFIPIIITLGLIIIFIISSILVLNRKEMS